MRTVTRDSQRVDVAYACPNGAWFVTTDGEGRLWYDTWDELELNHGDLPVTVLDETPED